MKAWIFSGLYLEADPGFTLLEIPDADVCLCSGEILDGGIARVFCGWLRSVPPTCLLSSCEVGVARTLSRWHRLERADRFDLRPQKAVRWLWVRFYGGRFY